MPLDVFNRATAMLSMQLAQIAKRSTPAAEGLNSVAAAARTTSDALGRVLQAIHGTQLSGLAGDAEATGYLQVIVATLDKLKTELDPRDRVETMLSLRRVERVMKKIDPFFDLDNFERIVEKAATRAVVNVATGRTPVRPGVAIGGSGISGLLPVPPAAPPKSDQPLSTLISTGQIKG